MLLRAGWNRRPSSSLLSVVQHGADFLALLQATVGDTELLHDQFFNVDWG